MPWRPVACVLPDICAAGFPLHIPFPRVIDQSVSLSLSPSLPLSLSSSLFFILYPRKPPICRSVNCVADEAACRARDRSENGERRKVKTRNSAPHGDQLKSGPIFSNAILVKLCASHAKLIQCQKLAQNISKHRVVSVTVTEEGADWEPWVIICLFCREVG